MNPEMRKYTIKELESMSMGQLRALYDEACCRLDDLDMADEDNKKTAEEAKNKLDNLVKAYYK